MAKSSQIDVRLNTQGMHIPLREQEVGRSVVNPATDLVFIPDVNTESDVPKDRGVIGIKYAHNVMPSTYGWRSISYLESVADPVLGSGSFTRIVPVAGATVTGGKVNASGIRSYLGVFYNGANSVLYYLNAGGAWTPVSGVPTLSSDAAVSAAYINGVSYISIPGHSVYVINLASGALTERPLASLNMADIKGVTSAYGYLIVWTVNRVLWSSSVDVEDFTPSDTSGAGGGAVQEASGDIIYCGEGRFGFFVYTRSNIVSALYTSNATFPFEFIALAGSGGIYSPDHIAKGTVAAASYAYSSSGIQKITQQAATTTLPHISDFLDNSYFEDFDTVTGVFSSTTVGSTGMKKAIQTVASRFVVLSYGADISAPFTHALVIDTQQGRMGKLKINHVACVDFFDLSLSSGLDSNSSLAFLGAEGSIKAANFDTECAGVDAVVLMGDLTYAHGSMAQLQEVEVENVCAGAGFSMYTLPTLDGSTFEPKQDGYVRQEDLVKPLRRFMFSSVAKSHTLVFVGGFELNTVVARITKAGRY